MTKNELIKKRMIAQRGRQAGERVREKG